jgi:hypothetical protein
VVHAHMRVFGVSSGRTRGTVEAGILHLLQENHTSAPLSPVLCAPNALLTYNLSTLRLEQSCASPTSPHGIVTCARVGELEVELTFTPPNTTRSYHQPTFVARSIYARSSFKVPRPAACAKHRSV